MNFVFLLLCLIVIIINVDLSVRLKEVSSDIFNDSVIHQSDRKRLIEPFRLLVQMIFIHYVLNSLLDFFKGRIGIAIFRSSLIDATRETVAMENSEFHRQGIGKVQEGITHSSYAMYEAVVFLLVEVPQCVIMFIRYTIELYSMFRPRVAMVYFGALAVALFTGVLLTVFVNRFEAWLYGLYRATLVTLTNILLNFDIVQSYRREEREVKNYDESYVAYDAGVQRYQMIRETFSCTQKYLLMLPHFVIVYLFLTGFDTGLLPSKILYYNLIFMAYRSNLTTLRSYMFTISKRAAEVEPRMKQKVKNEADCVAITGFNDKMVLASTDLYAGDSLINTNISFTINRGEKVAITGYNGSGKSTFLKTLCRFHHSRGSFSIDGVEINSITDASIRDLIAYVPQDHHIFNNTVIYNLGYGQTKYDEAEIYRICKLYGFHDFFSNLPNGYFTQAGEHGKYLSGGQKQRINFMRAILKGAPIIILDEPTSNLDKAAEVEMIDSIITHCRDRTVLIIIHNLDLLNRFEKILYFKKNGVEVFHSVEEFEKNK